MASNFEIYECLGQGGYGFVARAHNISTGEPCALKVLPRMRKGRDYRDEFRHEVSVMKALDSKYIARYCASYETDEQLYVASELCSGGELFKRIIHDNKFSEAVASRYTRQMLEALQFVHSKRVAHLDLKPENWVFIDNSETARLKLIDFGGAKAFSSKSEKHQRHGGTVFYLPPEAIVDSSAQDFAQMAQQDVWSIGVIVYAMTTGRLPFGADDRKKIMRRIVSSPLVFPSENKLSPNLVDLLQRLMEKDRVKRLTVEQALAHPWITTSPSEALLPAELYDCLDNFLCHAKLKMLVSKVLARDLAPEIWEEVRPLFSRLDENGDGVLDVDEVHSMLLRQGMSSKKAAATAKQLFVEYDIDQNGVLSLEEFSAMSPLKQLSVDEKLVAQTFADLDKDNSGFISLSELKAYIVAHPEAHALNGAKALLVEVDTNNDGKISRDEFKLAMQAGSH